MAYNSDFQIIVDSIAIQEIYGKMRRKYYFDYYEMIEGIGYSRGLLTSFTEVTSAAWGVRLIDYCVGDLFSCNLLTQSKNISKSSILVYPNPTSGPLIIDGDITFSAINIYTITGQKVKLPLTNEVNIHHLNSGIYLMEIVEISGKKYYFNVIKMN